MSTPLAVFGPGILIAQRTDITIPAPINVGYVQEFSIETAATNKALYGQKKFPLVQAQGTIKATGKMKNATLSGLAINAMMYAGTFSTSNVLQWNIDSTFTTSTTAATITVGSSLTFESDLGVRYASGNLPLQRVSTGSEAVGKYSVSGTNVYTFGGTDITSATPIKITYTTNNGTGQALIVSNTLIGTTPTFQLDYYTNLNQPTSKAFIVRIYQCISEKLAMSFKLEDYMTPELDFGLFANNSDQVYDFVFPEVS